MRQNLNWPWNRHIMKKIPAYVLHISVARGGWRINQAILWRWWWCWLSKLKTKGGREKYPGGVQCPYGIVDSRWWWSNNGAGNSGGDSDPWWSLLLISTFAIAEYWWLLHHSWRRNVLPSFGDFLLFIMAIWYHCRTWCCWKLSILIMVTILH